MNQDLKLHGLIGGGSNIKSIQRGSSVVSAISTDVTISAVDLTKAVVTLSFKSPIGGTYASKGLIRGGLTSATNLNLSISDSANFPTVDWVIVEFNNVKSLQSGNKVTSVVSDSVTISTVNMAKAILFFSYLTSSFLTDFNGILLNVTLATSTSITIKQATAINKDINWFVVEFN